MAPTQPPATPQDPSEPVPRAALYGGLFLISVGTLLLELLHTRLLSFMLQSSLVYIVVTFAMVGFGLSGVALAIFPPSRFKRPARYLSFLAFAFATTAIAGIALLGRFPISLYSVRSDPSQFLLLIVYYLVFITPYFFSGLCIASIFTTQVQQISRLYCVNLAGSAVGCLLLVLLISAIGGENTLLLTGVFGLAAAMTFSIGRHRRLLATCAALSAALIAAMLIGGEHFIVLKIDPSKMMGRHLSNSQDPAKIVYTAWSPISRTDVLTAKWMDEGESITHIFGRPWPHQWIFADGAAGTPLISALPDDLLQELQQDEMATSEWLMLGYQIVDNPDILIIGVGGGADVLAARIRGITKITGVDINPVTVHIMKEVLSEYNGDLYNEPGIDIRVAEGRSFVHRSEKKYTNIHMHGVDTYNALASGAYVMAENYLYTTDAMADYMDHLTGDGVLSIVRMSFDPPRETIKLCTALIEAFPELGLGQAADHVMIFGVEGSVWTTLLCKKSPFTPDQISLYEEIARKQNKLIYYKPGMELKTPLPESLRRNRYFVELFEASREGTSAAFIEDYPFDIRPATDDKPFFYNVHRMRDYFKLGNPNVVHRENIGIFTLMVLLIQTLAMTLVLTLIPLWWFHRAGLHIQGRSRYLAYFAGLGLAFMLLELALMQKLSLYLGHPTYSISVVLSTLLVGSGLGSLASGALPWRRNSVIRASIGAIVVIVLLYLAILPALIDRTFVLPFALRVGIVAGLIGPLSFFMGMPFPSGLSLITQRGERFVPWAWGVNGIASVLGSVAAIFLAMSFGFTSVLIFAIGCYIVAALSLPRPDPGA